MGRAGETLTPDGSARRRGGTRNPSTPDDLAAEARANSRLDGGSPFVLWAEFSVDRECADRDSGGQESRSE